jgi:type I restriction enzyme, S subunit
MNLIPLKQLVTISAGQGAPKNATDFSKTGIPFIRAGSLDKLLQGEIEECLELVGEKTAKKYRLKLFPKDSVIFAKSGMSATKDRVYRLKNPAYLVNHLAVLIPSDEINPEYLVLALRRFKPSRLIKDFAYPSINQKEIEAHRIPVPEDPNDQIRIATLLNRVEMLIATRKGNLRLLNEFLKSTFLEMFGNLLKNEKGFNPTTLDKIKDKGKGTFSNGPFGSDLLTSELNKSGGIPVIYIRDIKDGELSWNSNIFVTKEKADSLPNCKVTIGDIVITKVGDPPGTAAINREFMEAVITQDVIRLRVRRSKANPIYVQYFLNSEYGRWIVKKITIKGTRSRFPLKEFKGLIIPLPPMKLQNQFSETAEKVESLKIFYKRSFNELETLYGALSQKAFKGELDLSRIPLDKEHEEVVSDETPEVVDQAPKPDSYAMSDPAAREKLLRQLFDAFIAEHKGGSFSMKVFWANAEQKLLEHMDDESPPPGAVDYDKTRAWLFELLESGRIDQRFDEENNRMELNIKT